MRGIDISHYQNSAGAVDLKKAYTNGFDFCIVKCTESLGFKDQYYAKNKKLAREAGVLFGAYHFARHNDPVKEADFFLANVGDLLPGELVALDYELRTFDDPATWCLAWLKRVEEKLGFKPLLYTYHDLLLKYNWKKVSDNDNGLWAARYGLYTQEPMQLFKPTNATWLFVAIWQYNSRGKVAGIVGNCDLNTTVMDIETLKKYGKKKAECNKACPVHCPK